MLGTRRRRPTRAEIDPAALELIARHGPQILATARRYSLNADDAEDAYQRGLEILLTKAPTTRPEELVPWLKTVVKHEAFAIRRQRERATPVDDPGVLDREAHEHDTDERAARYERLRLGAEALKRLKPQEVRCLLLRAEGYSYKQICEITGYSYTKVNRCLTEGRAAFLARIEGIQSGAECERLAPLLSRLADGEATAADMQALRPHLRGCSACRARLREYREAPRHAAALLPPALLAGTPAAEDGNWLESALGWLSDRATAVAVKAQGAASGAFDAASAQKVAAVAASTAVLAGGGVATIERLDRQPPPDRRHRAATATPAAPASQAAPLVPTAAPATAPAVSPDRMLARDRAQGREARRRDRERETAPESPASSEFELTPAPGPPPARNAGPTASPRPSPRPRRPPAGTGPSPAEAEFGL